MLRLEFVRKREKERGGDNGELRVKGLKVRERERFWLWPLGSVDFGLVLFD